MSKRKYAITKISGFVWTGLEGGFINDIRVKPSLILHSDL